MASTEFLLHEILLYTKAQAIPAARATALKALNTKTRAQIYQALDGKTSQADLAKARKVKPQSIQPFVQSFLRAGLAAPASAFDPNPKALFTLAELGIDIDALPDGVPIKARTAKEGASAD